MFDTGWPVDWKREGNLSGPLLHYTLENVRALWDNANNRLNLGPSRDRLAIDIVKQVRKWWQSEAFPPAEPWRSLYVWSDLLAPIVEAIRRHDNPATAWLRLKQHLRTVEQPDVDSLHSEIYAAEEGASACSAAVSDEAKGIDLLEPEGGSASAQQEQEADTLAGTPATGKKRKQSGRPKTSDPEADAKLAQDWKASELPSHKDFAQARGLPLKNVQRAIERHRSRLRRQKS
jgi:hypothetical protein